ncbi:arginine n-methyltransferase [Achlya hypogyna]|uniref:type I protein arginine methyltransferase n=1 Tax=Achlya hypogyna TaxID=1202772 RepID=A0A1V9YJC2_ACHHY|nr:arginine n-methyltransferase [Achlya hypogyna]
METSMAKLRVEDDVEACIEENEPETWEDWEEEDEAMKCFFCPFQHNQLASVLGHAKEVHTFDFRAVAASLQLDFYGMVRLINFARVRDPAAAAAELSARGMDALAGDDLLIPVIPEDPMLCRVMDLDADESDDDDNDDAVQLEEKAPAPVSLEAQNASLQSELENLRDQLAHYSTIVRAFADDETTPKEAKEPDNDTYYFDSYSQVGIHKEMITDKVRTDSYRDAILNNKELFAGKIVLDVGCGTGILSMFAAQAGAAKVIGIDCSDMGVTAQKIVKDNGFGDIITIIRGKVELVTLPVDHVDIIISEWMGYNLLYESMLDTVLFARDKWLVPGGLLFPDKATMFLQGAYDSSERLGFWKHVYGFDMTAVRDRIETTEAFIEVVAAQDILTDRALVETIDIPSVTLRALDFSKPFKLVAAKDGLLHGFVSSFDIGFETALPRPLWFSTGCEVTPTHWQQTFFHVKTPFHVRAGDEIVGTWSVRRNAVNPRFLDVDFAWTHGPHHFTEKFSIH